MFHESLSHVSFIFNGTNIIDDIMAKETSPVYDALIEPGHVDDEIVGWIARPESVEAQCRRHEVADAGEEVANAKEKLVTADDKVKNAENAEETLFEVCPP